MGIPSVPLESTIRVSVFFLKESQVHLKRFLIVKETIAVYVKECKRCLAQNKYCMWY